MKTPPKTPEFARFTEAVSDILKVSQPEMERPSKWQISAECWTNRSGDEDREYSFISIMSHQDGGCSLCQPRNQPLE